MQKLMQKTTQSPMKKPVRTATLFLAIGLACAAGSLSAQENEAKRGQINDLDTDGDGAISFVEFQAVEGERFAAADSNGDGFLSFEEFTASAPRPERHPEGREIDAERQAQMQARMQERALEQFADMDANGDDLLSLLEMQEAQFLRLDRDNNGLLEGRELRGPGRGPDGARGPQGPGGPRGDGGRRPPRQGQSEAIQ